MNLRTLGASCVVALACALANAAYAEPAASGDPVFAARTLGYEGVAAYQAGNYVLADQKLNRAYQLLPVPSLGLWSARALVKLNFLVEASRRYTEVVQSHLLAGDTNVHRQAQLDAQADLAALLPVIPRLSLRLEGAVWDEIALTIDSVPVTGAAREAPILVNPGERQIAARRGQERVVIRIALAASEQKTALLQFAVRSASARHESSAADLRPQAPADGSAAGSAPVHDTAATWRTAGWVAIGVGGSALLLSGVAGLVAWGKTDEFDCRQEPCKTSDADALSTYHSLVTASTIGYIAGGLVAGGGALLLLKYGTTDGDVTVGVGPLSAAVGGRF